MVYLSWRKRVRDVSVSAFLFWDGRLKTVAKRQKFTHITRIFKPFQKKLQIFKK